MVVVPGEDGSVVGLRERELQIRWTVRSSLSTRQRAKGGLHGPEEGPTRSAVQHSACSIKCGTLQTGDMGMGDACRALMVP